MLIKITHIHPAHADDPTGYPVFYGHLLEDHTIFYDGVVWTLEHYSFVTDADAYIMTSITLSSTGHSARSMMIVYEEA